MVKEFKRSLTIAGHRTSLSLEPEFWEALTQAAAARKISLASLVAEIDSLRGERNLSSAIRVWLLQAKGRATPVTGAR
ncbi:MAG: ribbon-helix-helix domain-containing protein [Rhizobiales bacterium]|nr:ribbon-helix-helix domain-containing protein [Hyphomicrobiales bacterium]